MKYKNNKNIKKIEIIKVNIQIILYYSRKQCLFVFVKSSIKGRNAGLYVSYGVILKNKTSFENKKAALEKI